MLTTAERTFLESSFGSSVEKASEQMLRSAIRKARDLRDKWLDAFTRQNRANKRARGPAVKGALGTPIAPSPSNLRSREKADLFDGALRRLEERLRAILAPAPAAPQAVPAVSAKPARSGRSSKQSGKRSVALKKATKAAAGRSRKALDAATLATRSVAASGQRVKTDLTGQRAAKAAARKARANLQGLATHRNAHSAARVRRAQARRDVRRG